MGGRAPDAGRHRRRAAGDAGRRTGAVWVQGLLLLSHLGPEGIDAPAAVAQASGAGGGRIVAITRAAEALGAKVGQRRIEALAHAEGLHVVDLDPERLAAAQTRLVRAVATVSPVVEDARAVSADPGDPVRGAGLVRFDARGLSLLHPRPEDLALACARAASEAGLPGARIALGRGPSAAAILAVHGSRGSRETRGGRGGATDRAALAPLPLAALDVPERPGLGAEALGGLWLLSVRTIGAFAALPAASVETRLGTVGLALHRLARGDDARPLVPFETAAPLVLRRALPYPVSRRPTLLRALAPLAGDLARGLEKAGLGLSALEVAYRLERGAVRRRIEVLSTSPGGDDLCRLLELDLEARPLPAAVVEVALRAGRTVARETGQGELFAAAARPAGLERAVARLAGRLGPGGVGAAVLDDRLRPEAAYHLEPVGAAPRRGPSGATDAVPAGEGDRPAAPLSLRLYPAPRPVRVEAGPDGRPARVDGRPATAAGPFPMSGEWWSTPYDRAYFEVDAGEALLWIFHDATDGRWYVHGLFD